MVLFIVGQLFINYKHGMVFSPFYHYGMYSEVMKEKSSYRVFEIQVNGRELQAKGFTPQQWDNIILPLNYYASINKSNALYQTDIKRLMNTIHISVNDINYMQNCDSKGFEKWYKNYLSSVLKEDIATLNILYRSYQYNSGSLQPTDSSSSISQLCS